MKGAGEAARSEVLVYVGTSLDGFIARKDGDVNWGPTGGGSDYGYAAFMKRIDALVMGRGTFEKALTFEGWPPKGKPVVVLTHRPLKVPARMADTVEPMAGTPRQVIARLARRGLKRLYIDGGKTIQAFLDAGLVDEITVTRVPVLLGEGIPLFGPLKRDLLLKHVRTRAWPDGYVQSTYRPPARSSARHR